MKTEKLLPALLTYAEAANELTVGVSTVRRLCKQGRLKLHRIAPRCHRIEAASLQAYLRETLAEPQLPRSTSQARAVSSKRNGAEAPMTVGEAIQRAKEILRKSAQRNVKNGVS